MKAIVFDLGGTLMEYKGMPLSWADYYSVGFSLLNQQYSCAASDELINESVEILKSYNPRLYYRGIEYSPRHIMSDALKHWNINCSIDEMIVSFFEGLHLTPIIYDEVIPVLQQLKEQKYKVAALTDLPTAMPDDIFKKDINELLQYFDLYVSSLNCGFRKPNPKGLIFISEQFGIDRNEILFVGDEEKDRNTAINAGRDFIKINREDNNKNDKVFTLQDLMKII